MAACLCAKLRNSAGRSFRRAVGRQTVWICRGGTFPWFEAPNVETLVRSEQLLRWLGAADAKGTLTELGRMLARLPVAPRLGCLLIAGTRAGLASEAAGVVGAAAGGRAPVECPRPPRTGASAWQVRSDRPAG